MPHSLVLIFGDTVRAAEAFDRHMPPDVPRIILVDTFRDEAEEALRVADALGDRLYGIRLDTPSRAWPRHAGPRPRGPGAPRPGRATATSRSSSVAASTPSASASSRRPGRRSTRTRSAATSAARQPIDFTGDLKEIDGKPIAKRGRIPGLTPSPRLQKLDLARGDCERQAVTAEARNDVGQDGCGDRVSIRGGWIRQTRSRLAELAERETAYGLFQRAQALLKRRHYAQAAVSWSAPTPRAAQGLDRRGARPRLLQQRPARSCGRRFRELLDIDPSAAYGHFGLGQSLKQLGRRDEARVHLRLAVALAPREQPLSQRTQSARRRLNSPRTAQYLAAGLGVALIVLIGGVIFVLLDRSGPSPSASPTTVALASPSGSPSFTPFPTFSAGLSPGHSSPTTEPVITPEITPLVTPAIHRRSRRS